jgi:hypothetical protein
MTTSVDAASEQDGYTGDIEVEPVASDKYKSDDGTALTRDEIVRRHLANSESASYAFVDGGTSAAFPRLGLTDAERQTFLSGLRPAIDQLYDAAAAGA